MIINLSKVSKCTGRHPNKTQKNKANGIMIVKQDYIAVTDAKVCYSI